ncbi:hypothetical protein Tco_1247675 [Tanacetum coccineum]
MEQGIGLEEDGPWMGQAMAQNGLHLGCVGESMGWVSDGLCETAPLLPVPGQDSRAAIVDELMVVGDGNIRVVK